MEEKDIFELYEDLKKRKPKKLEIIMLEDWLENFGFEINDGKTPLYRRCVVFGLYDINGKEVHTKEGDIENQIAYTYGVMKAIKMKLEKKGFNVNIFKYPVHLSGILSLPTKEEFAHFIELCVEVEKEEG